MPILGAFPLSQKQMGQQFRQVTLELCHLEVAMENDDPFLFKRLNFSGAFAVKLPGVYQK